MAILKWSSETLANTTAIGDQDQPAVAALASGGFVVMWRDQGPADAVVRFQIYNALGVPVGAEQVSGSFAGDQSGPSVVGLADGTFFFQQGNSDGANVDISGRVLTGTGTAVRTQSAFDGSAVAGEPDVATVGPFGTVAVWTNFSAGAGNIIMRGFNNDGTERFSAFTVNTNAAGSLAAQQSQAAVASSTGNGDIAVVWRDLGLNGGDIRCRVFNSSGTQKAAEFTVNAVTSDLQGEPDIVWLDDSRFLVVWVSETTANPQGDGDGTSIQGRLFRSDGVSLTDQFLINATTSGDQSSPTVVALPNGGFAVAWTDASGTGLDQDMNAIRMRVFDAGGTPAGSEVVINTTTDGSQTAPSLSVLADGRIVVTWADGSATGNNTDGSAIRFQIVDPRDGVIVGTGGDDTLYGHDGAADEFNGGNGNDTMHGLRGNDTFYAGKGNDTAVGGLGDDVMFGADGNDVLNGGAGVDLMDGGLGDDLFFVDSSTDTVIERAGEGANDQISTSASYTLGAAVAVEFLLATSGTSALNLTGNGFSQRIVGNQGANVLADGGGAADQLSGLGGNDTYLVDASGTTIEENSEGGNDTVVTSVTFALGAGVSVETITTNVTSGTASINLTGNALRQTIIGNNGANVFHDGGVGANDTLQGFGGNDTYRVFNFSPWIRESAKGGTADRVLAAVDFRLSPDTYVEIITTNGSIGTAAIDLTGNKVAQSITGNAGSNILDGQGGNDTLTGLGGKDFFAFSSSLGPSNVDTITDFNVADDTIQLENAVFTALATTGTLAASAFRINTTGLAESASDRIIYETDTGELYYDHNGSAVGGGVLFAKLDPGLSLTNADFVVI
jgi:Ca2+-binding RTX toxin-like protein